MENFVPVLDPERLHAAYDKHSDQVLRWSKEVQRRREHLGLSREQLARRSGTTVAYIWRIEQGMRKPRDNMRTAIASALDCETDEVFPYLSKAEAHEIAGVVAA